MLQSTPQVCLVLRHLPWTQESVSGYLSHERLNFSFVVVVYGLLLRADVGCGCLHFGNHAVHTTRRQLCICALVK